MDEGPAPARQPALDDERVPRGEEHLGDRRRVGEVQARRHPEGEPAVGDELLGVAATGLDAHHLVARLPVGDPGADGGDDPGVLQAEDLGRHRDRVRIAAHALQHVGAVHGGVMDVDEDLVGTCDRSVDVGDAPSPPARRTRRARRPARQDSPPAGSGG